MNKDVMSVMFVLHHNQFHLKVFKQHANAHKPRQAKVTEIELPNSWCTVKHIVNILFKCMSFTYGICIQCSHCEPIKKIVTTNLPSNTFEQI